MSIIAKPETMIPFKNEISVKYEKHHFPLKPVSKSLVLEAKPKLWSAKYFLHEECDEHDHNKMPKVGQGVTVLFIFGNYGATTWKTDGHTTTVEDYFEIAKGLHLVVKDINVACFYELWVLNYGYENKCKELKKGDVLLGGKTYILQLRKKTEHGPATPYFDIPCHSVNSFAITFLTAVECEEKKSEHCKEPKKDKDDKYDNDDKYDKYDKYDKDDKYDKYDKCDKEPKKDVDIKEKKEPICPREFKEERWGKISSYSIGEDMYR